MSIYAKICTIWFKFMQLYQQFGEYPASGFLRGMSKKIICPQLRHEESQPLTPASACEDNTNQ